MSDNNVDQPRVEKTIDLGSAWIWKEGSKVPDSLQEWWDEKDIRSTLRDMLPAVVEVLSCRAKLSMVRCIACNRMFVGLGAIAHFRFDCSKCF